MSENLNEVLSGVMVEMRNAECIEALSHYLSFRLDGIGHRVAVSLAASIVCGHYAKPTGWPMTPKSMSDAASVFHSFRKDVSKYLNEQGEANFAKFQ